MPISRIPPDVFFLDRASGRSLQAQLRETVVALLRTGQAAPGARLPSSRKLAAHLGIARMTVTLAYQELVAQGVVEARDRRGYVLSKGAMPELPRPLRAEPRRAGAPDWDGFLDLGLSQRRRVIKPPDWRHMPYPFVYGQMADRVLMMAGGPGRIIADIPIDTPRADRSEAKLADIRSTLKSMLLKEPS